MDRTAVFVHNLFDNREPDAGTHLAGPRDLSRLRDATEAPLPSGASVALGETRRAQTLIRRSRPYIRPGDVPGLFVNPASS